MTASPVFVATFVDGVKTRMTIWSETGEPNLRRGVRLAKAACESRTRQPAPALVEAHFEGTHGEVLKSYDAAALNGKTPASPAPVQGTKSERRPALKETDDSLGLAPTREG
jgi:hypothetical protein